MISIKINKITKIILAALIVRLVVLLVIFIVTPEWSVGFMGDTVSQDDVRYESGAMYYSRNAKSLVDPAVFSSAYSSLGDYVGLVDNIFSATPLWYWVVCIVCYFFKNIIAVRLLNIVLSIASIYLLYKLVRRVWNEDIALTSSKMLAFLPYPIVFSCFGYKDHLIMFLTLALLYFALEYRISEKANLRMIIKSIIVALGLLLLRGGLSAILIVLCLSVAFWNVDLQGRKRIILRYVMILLVAGTSVFLLSMSMGDILLKVQYYITDRDVSEVGSIGLVTINRVSDLYKIPFTFLFAIVMPLGKITDISSWAGIVGSLNVVMAPIAIGAAIDIFLHKREELVLVGTCLVYYLLSIVSSIGIFRHYYSLLFIPIMLYSHMRHQSGNNIRHLWRIGSALYGFLLIIYVLI